MDDDEDRRYGKDKRGDELPEELAFRESRLRKIREAKAALEPRNSDGNPDSPQVVVFLATIVDVTVGS